VAAEVRPGSRLADIGTDHAWLPIDLVGRGVCPAAVATDIQKGPADTARRHIEAAGLSDKIEVRVGDGLAPLSPADGCRDVVVAGMGGETIAAILAAADWVRDPALRLILQPMSRPEKLREFLYENGFGIERETVAREGSRCYVCMAASYIEKQDRRPPDRYIGKLPQSADAAVYMRRQLRRLRDGQKGRPGDLALAELIKELEDWTDDCR